MPRYARRKCDTGIFHIMLRGINKQTIFEDDEDKERFLDTIERFKEVSKYEIYGLRQDLGTRYLSSCPAGS